MSTEKERELRQVLNQARQRRAHSRGMEGLMAFTAALLAITMLVLGLNGLSHDIPTWTCVSFLLLAAFYNLYGNVILQPNVKRTQGELNTLIEQEKANNPA